MIAIIAVELIPIPEPVQYVPVISEPAPKPAVYKAPVINSGSVTTLTVFGTSSLTTLHVEGG
ncbi:MAG: hypothetical protein ACE5J7_02465 [Candidatus Aenigmatarchaeota archaeon]